MFQDENINISVPRGMGIIYIHVVFQGKNTQMKGSQVKSVYLVFQGDNIYIYCSKRILFLSSVPRGEYIYM